MPFFFSTDSLSLVQLIMIQKGRLLEDEARFYTAEVADVLEYKHRDWYVEILRYFLNTWELFYLHPKTANASKLAANELTSYGWWTYQNCWFWECLARADDEAWTFGGAAAYGAKGLFFLFRMSYARESDWLSVQLGWNLFWFYWLLLSSMR